MFQPDYAVGEADHRAIRGDGPYQGRATVDGEDEHRHGHQITGVGVTPDRLFERHHLAKFVDGGEVADLDVVHERSGGKSASVVITGNCGGRFEGISPERRSSTARIPAASAPSMSCLMLSPTIIA